MESPTKEEQLIPLLAATQSGTEVHHAEQQLRAHWSHPDYATALVSIAKHDSVPSAIRQAAVSALKQFIRSCWSPHFDEFQGEGDDDLVPEAVKSRVRGPLLELVTSESLDGRVRAIASSTVSRIAGSDFPDRWPDLLDTLLHIISTGSDGQLHGALKVLADLVEDGFGEKQFVQAAKHLVQVAFDVAVNDTKSPTLRALAVSVFRHCLGNLETFTDPDNKDMNSENHQVRSFAEQAVQQWIPFLLQILQTRLPDPPSEQEEKARTANAEMFKGSVALKLQVVKVCLPFYVLL
jgi:hypothetical protein